MRKCSPSRLPRPHTRKSGETGLKNDPRAGNRHSRHGFLTFASSARRISRADTRSVMAMLQSFANLLPHGQHRSLFGRCERHHDRDVVRMRRDQHAGGGTDGRRVWAEAVQGFEAARVGQDVLRILPRERFGTVPATCSSESNPSSCAQISVSVLAA